MSKILSLIIWSILTQLNAAGQSKWGFENYNYLNNPGQSAIVPVMHFETQKNLYAELRYNYESAGTLTLLGGKTFSGKKGMTYSFTPMLGISAGGFTGISLAAETDLEWERFYFSLQAQRSFSVKQSSEGFFFSWSELGYDIHPHFFGGLALQTGIYKEGDHIEPGLTAGLSFGNFRFPFYLFNPLRNNQHIVLGMNYEWRFKRKSSS